MENETVVHDMSRVNSFMASRRRAMIFHSVWKPMLAGAVGAAIISATVIGSMWVASPKLHFNEIEVPKIVQRDVTVDHVVPKNVTVPNIITKDVTVDHYVPHDVPIPTPTPEPQASTFDPSPAPRTPAEKKLEETKGWQDSVVHGRILRADKNGFILMADDGEQSFYPATQDKNGETVPLTTVRDDVDPYIGDLGYCREQTHGGNKAKQHFLCSALHNGKEEIIRQVPYTAPKTAATDTPPANPAGGTKPADTMVQLNVDVNGYELSAMVDTGCSWPMSIPQDLADRLVSLNRAARTTPAKSTLADGMVQDTEVVVINYVTVDGRRLTDVTAAIAPNGAPILLGLGALNRLGQYTITDGTLTFTGEQPS